MGNKQYINDGLSLLQADSQCFCSENMFKSPKFIELSLHVHTHTHTHTHTHAHTQHTHNTHTHTTHTHARTQHTHTHTHCDITCIDPWTGEELGLTEELLPYKGNTLPQQQTSSHLLNCDHGDGVRGNSSSL